MEDGLGMEGGNWLNGSFYGLAPHSGSQYFETDNGNFNHNFLNERHAKRLGGTIQPFPYQVSFFIAANSLGGIGMEAVELSDFSELAIGGAGGSMVWLNTPTPGVGQGWVEWTGLYAPSVQDLGTPFQFRMTVDIDSRHSLAIDGPMMAMAIPEPPALVLSLVVIISSVAGRVAAAAGAARRGAAIFNVDCSEATGY